MMCNTYYVRMIFFWEGYDADIMGCTKNYVLDLSDNALFGP